MRGIYILVEGVTEEEFVEKVLAPYLIKYEIYDVRPILMQTSPGFKGGDVKYVRYKNNAERLLHSEKDVVVTSLIDFFRLQSDFPNYSQGLTMFDKVERVEFLENEILKDTNHPRFIPYIQLHEFEGLLFSDIEAFNILPELSPDQQKKLKQIVDEYPNPELINDKPETAPSKRLKQIIPTYKKTLHGPYLAEEIGMEQILKQCPRFAVWVNKLILFFENKKN